MFQRLKQKWKVTGLQLLLIICTFAIGGSLTGFAGKKLMNLFFIDQHWLWLVVYVIVVTLLWPFTVLLVSIPFGQYRFFIKYLEKMGSRMGLMKKMTNERLQITGNEQGVIGKIQFATGNWQQTTDNRQ